MSKDCKTCQRFDRRREECLVMNELIKDCWAWTDDKAWARKVRKATEEYRKARGLGYEDR